MKADLTRRSFDPHRHFSRVLMQQGRVQLDADWNEQSAIMLHLVRRLTADLVGPVASAGTAFDIGLLQTQNAVVDDIALMPGDFYLDGILCELESTPVAVVNWNGNTITVAEWTIDGTSYQAGQYVHLWDQANPATPAIDARIVKPDYTAMTLTLDRDVSALSVAGQGRVRRIVTYLSQPDLPDPPPLQPSTYQLYLDVWERLITCLEDDDIREVALNGPDTAARTRVVWQVKALPTKQESCMTQQQLIDALQPINRGLLRARTQPASASTDPCTISPDSNYRGPENQLYRVEIHTGANDPSGRAPSFKWSRENGSVVFPIVGLATSDNATTTVTLGNLGRDDRFGLLEGDFVEVQDDLSVLAQIPGTLLQVQSIDRTGLVVILAGTTTPGVGADATRHPLLRRWDHKATGAVTLGPDNAVLIPQIGGGQPPTASQVVWLDLEDGVQVEFADWRQPNYRSGDYWLIPARVATGDVLWPIEVAEDAQQNPISSPVARRPDGVLHHFAPLALATLDGKVINLTPCGGGFRGMRTARSRSPVVGRVRPTSTS